MKRQRKHQIRISRELSEYISKVNKAIDGRDLDSAAELVGYSSFEELAKKYNPRESYPPPRCYRILRKAESLEDYDGMDHVREITGLVEKILEAGGFKEEIELKKQFPHLHSLLDKGKYMEVVSITGIRLGDAELYLRGRELHGRAAEFLGKAEKAGMELEFKQLAIKIAKVGTEHQESEYR